MLNIYVAAVAKMMQTPASSPLSWQYQWYIHAIPTNTTKTKALAATFTKPGPELDLANSTWETCEAHFSGNEDAFLPWHRMYLYRFEEIIRAVSGRPEFTLPYWNYTSPSARSLPPQFLNEADKTWGKLFRPNRRVDVKKGGPIDNGVADSEINLQDMKSATYRDNGADAGFCANLDGNLHGNVHGDIGNTQGMGSVPWAANDPIFWLHHCNIDRIWASWNKAGGINPDDEAFKRQHYTFANQAGAPVEMAIGDVLDTTALGYVYDQYLDRPADSQPFLKAGATFSVLLHATPKESPGAVSLTRERLDVPLRASETIETKRAPGLSLFGTQISQLTADRSLHVRLENLTVQGETDLRYDVYINLARGVSPTRQPEAYVGTLNFFGVGLRHSSEMVNMPGMAPMAHSRRTVSFPISSALRARLISDATPTVTFFPAQPGAEGPLPKIGNVAIVSQ